MTREALVGAVIVIREARPDDDPAQALMATPNGRYIGELIGSGFVCETPLTVLTAAHPTLVHADPEDVEFITLLGRPASAAAVRVHPDAGVVAITLERAVGVDGHLEVALAEPEDGSAVWTQGYSAEAAESGRVLEGAVQRGVDRGAARMLETTLAWPASGRGGPLWSPDTGEVVGVAAEHGVAASAAALRDWIRG